MLKELVQAMVDKPEERKAFKRDPEAMFAKYDVPKSEREMLLARDQAALLSVLGKELLAALRALDVDDTLRYPGFAVLQIADIKPTDLRANVDLSLEVSLKWEHADLPQKGLPVWMVVDILQNGQSLDPDRLSAYHVPSKLDFEARTALIRKSFKFSNAGTYTVIVSAAHPEVRDSAPFSITVKP